MGRTPPPHPPPDTFLAGGRERLRGAGMRGVRLQGWGCGVGRGWGHHGENMAEPMGDVRSAGRL